MFVLRLDLLVTNVSSPVARILNRVFNSKPEVKADTSHVELEFFTDITINDLELLTDIA